MDSNWVSQDLRDQELREEENTAEHHILPCFPYRSICYILSGESRDSVHSQGVRSESWVPKAAALEKPIIRRNGNHGEVSTASCSALHLKAFASS